MCANTVIDLYTFFSKVCSPVWISLHVSTLSHTLHVPRWEKVGIFGKGGLWRKKQRVRGTDPCWAGCGLVGAQGVWHAWPCTEPTEVETGEWWEQGWQKLGQYLGNVSVKCSNSSNMFGKKRWEPLKDNLGSGEKKIQIHQRMMATQEWQTNGKAKQWLTIGGKNPIFDIIAN